MFTKRRAFVAGLTVVAASAPSMAIAKEPSLIAVLGSASEVAALSVNQMAWLRNGLRVVGLVEGQDFVFDVRWANGKYEQFPALAAEVIARRPSAIVVSTIAAAEAARALSKMIPIVMTGLNDPVGMGLVKSLARPGGNITGMATMNEEMILKLLGHLPSILPRAKRIITIRNPTNPSNRIMLQAIGAEAVRLGFGVMTVEVATPAALDSAFEEVRRQRPDVLLIIPDNALAALSQEIVSRALDQRIPVISTSRQSAEAGAIYSYGFDRRESLERSAFYLKKILGGANAADLPVEQPNKFELVINLRTARTLDIEISAAVLAEADEVVE